MTPHMFDSRLPARFWDKVIPEPNSGCWLWTAALTGGRCGGYGAFAFDGRRATRRSGGKYMKVAHRVTYETLVGEVPTGLDLDHICRTRSCCNPSHLEPVTRSVNSLRGAGGDVARARTRLITHCPKQHEYSGANLYRNPKGKRSCRKCQALAQAAYRVRRACVP